MVVTAEVGNGPLAELVKQVQAGNEVLLTQGDKTVARLVSTSDSKTPDAAPLKVPSFKGHRILTPVISHEELAEDMFGRQ